MEQIFAVATEEQTRMLVALLEHRLAILERRLAHADIETAQARVSRDSTMAKLDELVRALEDHGITLVREDGNSALQNPGGAPRTVLAEGLRRARVSGS